MLNEEQENTLLPEKKDAPATDPRVSIFSPNYIPTKLEPWVPTHDDKGNIRDEFISSYAGDIGQRLGITPARDEGPVRELGKGIKAGLTDWAAGTAGTLGAIDTQASLNALSDANQQWRASDRKQGISWAANLIGHTTGFNAPNLAAIIATGYATGGSSLAMKAAGFATTYLSMKDANDRELATRLPEASFSDRQALSFGITVAQGIIEQGVGANKATSGALAKMLAAEALKDQGAEAVKKGILSRVFGKLPMFGGKLGSGILKVQVEETIEEGLQEGLMDASVAVGKMVMGKDQDMTPAKLFQKYKQLGIDTFVGSLGLGVWGGTLNYIADHRSNVEAANILKSNKENKALVDSSGVQEKTPDGKVRYVVDPIKQARTFDFMNAFSQALGFGELNTDPTKRSGRQTALMNLAYNLAAKEIQTDKSKAALVTPEKYFEGLRVAILNDSTAAAKLASILARNGTFTEISNAINEIAPDTGKMISDVQENYKYVQLKRQVEDYGREISSKVATDGDMIEASRVARSVLSTGISLQVRDIGAGKEGAKRQVRQKAMDVLIDRMTPESFRKVYARGRIDGVKVGKDVVSIRLKIVNGEMTGSIMTESEVKAEMMLEEKAIAEDGKKDTAGLTTNVSEEYAKLKLKNLEYARAIERYNEFDSYQIKDKAQVAEDAKEMEKESQEDRDARQADTAERARMITRLLANIKEEMDLMPVEDSAARKQSTKFLARYGKKKKTAEGKPKKMEINEERIQEDAVSGTLAEELGKVEPELLKGIEAMSNRRKAKRYFKLLAPPRMVKYEADERKGIGFRGAYVRDMQLMALFEGHDIGTVIHEVVHHLVENALMPTAIDKILRHNFAVGTDKELDAYYKSTEEGAGSKLTARESASIVRSRDDLYNRFKETKILNAAEKENISDSFLLYLRDAVLPEDKQTAKAFSFIKGALRAAVRPFKQRYIDETGAIKTGAMDMKLNEATRQVLESLFSETTQDKLTDIYGKALGESLMLGDISDPIFLDDVESIKQGVEELANRKGITIEAMNNELLSTYAEVFENKTSLAQLDDIQRAQFYNILKKEMNEYEPGWKSKNETDRILFEQQGVASDIADKPLPPSAEEVWIVPNQAVSSSDTSINRSKLPGSFNRIAWRKGTVNADIGGGRFDNATAMLSELGVENVIYDPFNRSKEHNRKAVSKIAGGKADTATINNVLNVIKESDARRLVIRQAADAIGLNGTAYFLIYEGDASGQGKATTKGWQENRKAESYIEEIRASFGSVERRGNMLVATEATPPILFKKNESPIDKPLPPSAEEYVASIQGEIPTSAAILLTDGRVLEGKSHMAILQASMKMKGIGYAAEGAATNKRRFVSRHEAGVLSGIENPDSWTSALIGKVQPDQAKVDKAAMEFYEKKRLNPNFDRPYVMAEKRDKPLKDIAEVANDRKKLNSYIMWNLLDADKEAETRYTMQEFGKSGISVLTDQEAQTMAYDLQAIKEQERQQAKTIVPAETTGMTKELGGKYVNQYERSDPASRVGVLVGRRSLNWTTTLPALIDIITDRKENSSWKANVLDVLSKVANDADTIKNDFYKEWHNAGFTPQSTRFIYDSTDVDKITLNNSAMLFIYLMSNLGKDFKNQSMKKFMVANPEFNDEKLLSKIVKIVADDKRYTPIVKAMQKYNDRYFDIAAEKKADVIEKATGKRIKPKKINRAYTPEKTKGDLYIEGDEVIDQLTIPYAGGNIGLEPSEFMHRGALPKGEYNMDAFGNFFSHIERLIDYSAKVDAVYKVLSILENNKMRDAFIKTYGDDTYRQAIIKHVQRFMSPRGTLQIMGNTPFAKSVSHLNRMAYPAFLSWNLITTPVTQLTTVFPAVSALGLRAVPNFIGNIGRVMSEIAMNKFDITKTSFYKLASEVSPSSFNDLFPIAEREGVKMLLEYGAEALNGRLRGPFYEGLIKFRQKGMKPMAFTDMFVRLATYKTAFDMKYNELSNAVMNDDVRINKARVFAEEVIRKSHNPSSILDKTLMQTEASPFIKSVLAFTSQPQAMMNVMITDVYLPLLSAFQKSGVIGVGKEIVGNKAIWRKLAFGALLPGLALGAIARRRPQRDLEEVLSDSFIMGLASVVPVVGQGLWLSAVLGWGESGRDFSGIYGRFMKDTTAALSDVIQGEFDVSTLKSARRSMTLILGVPDAPIRVLEKLFEGKGAAESLLGKAAD